MRRLHAHADAINAHLFEGTNFLPLPVGDDRRRLNADGHTGSEAERDPRRLDHPADVVRLYERRGPPANIKADERLARCIQPLPVEIKFAQERVKIGILGLVLRADYDLPMGMMVYTGTRTILNVLRSIEPLIMAIVFAIWVSIGPFAGVLALTLHAIAALSKLYSEQVESIDQGPIEAITATGATRLQTIVYAVVPQIIPPYIAFTLYRWDINVRMSTIIGFVGGGGIGQAPKQWIDLLQYRQAGVATLAIAIVVAALDYISAKTREKLV